MSPYDNLGGGGIPRIVNACCLRILTFSYSYRVLALFLTLTHVSPKTTNCFIPLLYGLFTTNPTQPRTTEALPSIGRRSKKPPRTSKVLALWFSSAVVLVWSVVFVVRSLLCDLGSTVSQALLITTNYYLEPQLIITKKKKTDKRCGTLIVIA
jgi:hypothetical protein